jgi:protein TonB
MTTQTLPRLSTSLALAVLITGGLLLAMQAMIATGRAPLVDSAHRLLPALIPVIEETPVERRRKIEPPPPTQNPPIGPRIVTDRTTDVRILVPPPPGPAISERGGLTGQMDGSPIALVKVAATYPPRAIGRGLEGYVIVEYTVTALGAVTDVRVVEASDAIFEPSAVSAAEQFRYKPRIVAGEPVATPGVLNKFTFALED